MVEETLEEKLMAMRDSFRAGLAQRLVDIDKAWEQACAGDEDAQDTLHRLAHSLAGSGATFGLHDVSEASRALERAVEAVQETADIASSGAITARLAALRAVMEDAGERRAVDIDAPRPTAVRRNDDERRLIYLIEDDEDFAKNLAIQVGHFGYDVETYFRLTDLEAAINRKKPTAVIADIVFPKAALPASRP